MEDKSIELMIAINFREFFREFLYLWQIAFRTEGSEFGNANNAA